MSGKGFGPEHIPPLLEGERAAARRFVARYAPLLRTKIRCRRPGTSPAQVDDFVQETFCRVIQALRTERIQDPHRLGGFIAGVCENVMRESASGIVRLVPLDENQEVLRAMEDPEVSASAREYAALAEEVIRNLPDRDQQVVRLFFVDAQDRDEVCRRYQVKPGHLRVIVHRLRERLKSALLDTPDRPPLKNRA